MRRQLNLETLSKSSANHYKQNIGKLYVIKLLTTLRKLAVLATWKYTYIFSEVR